MKTTSWQPFPEQRPARRVLVIALDAVIPPCLRAGEVLVVAPATASRLRRWLSDEDGARRAATLRAAKLVDRLRSEGMPAEARMGDADALLAISDALGTFAADEIVIAAEAGVSGRPALQLAARARLRFGLPSRAGITAGRPVSLDGESSTHQKGTIMSTNHRHGQPRTGGTTVRASWLATAAAILAVGAAVAAAPGQARPQAKAALEPPTLENGVLTVRGTDASESIALRLEAGQRNLQVDFGDDGSAEFTVGLSGVQKLVVDAQGGDDSIRIDESNGRFTDTIPTTIDGGSGDDRISGGSGAETLIGGSGNDSIDGNRGNDVGLLGGGDDTFIWDPGDGSDTVEGQGGHDTMLFNGANAAEKVDLSANGDRLRFFRDVASITMDTHDVERVDFVALGGADTVTVGDLSGTGVRQVNVVAGNDGQADRVVVNATDKHDTVRVSGDSDEVDVKGLSADVSIQHPEAALDTLEVDGLAGNDKLKSSLPAGTIQLVADGRRVS